MLDDAAYNSDAAAPAAGIGVAIPPPDLTWTGAVPANGAVTITYSVTVNNPDTGDQILASTISSAVGGQQLPGRAAPTRSARRR